MKSMRTTMTAEDLALIFYLKKGIKSGRTFDLGKGTYIILSITPQI